MSMYKWFHCYSLFSFLYELFTFATQTQLTKRKILFGNVYLIFKFPLLLLANFLSLSVRKSLSLKTMKISDILMCFVNMLHTKGVTLNP